MNNDERFKWIDIHNERVKVNGLIIFAVVEKTELKVKNGELENPMTWRDKGTDSVIHYIMINNEVEKQ